MDKAQINALIPELFAPWIQQLDIRIDSLTDTEVVFSLPQNAALVRAGGTGGGVICGQALSAAIDTMSVLTLIHLNNRFRACTTSDLHVRFMRAIADGPVEVTVSALSNGRRMAVTQAACRVPGEHRVCAAGSATFVYLED